VARTEGPFIWHSHQDTDGFFYILSGSLKIELEGEQGVDQVESGTGELFVVPKGVPHRPVGDAEILLIEKCGVVNTGDAQKSSMTRVVEDVRVVK